MRSRVPPPLLAATFLVVLTAMVAVLLPASAPATSASTQSVPRYGAHNDVSTPFNVTHLPTLARTRFDGRGLRFDGVLRETLGHRRHQISYRSAGRRISGVLLEPLVEGPRPVVVVAHGYSHPANYTIGGQLEREQAALADAGYVVMQPDYRNHGASGREGRRTVARPRGYAEDLINAVRALRLARLPYADTERLGLLGRSMGGGVVMNALAARPKLADAVVLYSPLSATMSDNFN
ncbi:MAG: alpha/beta fold hydrolase, partial [Nocardioides sp.]|nr:alpha/beta fold hydrolase [Nocardioides sp.]